MNEQIHYAGVPQMFVHMGLDRIQMGNKRAAFDVSVCVWEFEIHGERYCTLAGFFKNHGTQCKIPFASIQTNLQCIYGLHYLSVCLLW